MRMLFILCEANVDERVMTLLMDAGVTGYTRFTGAFGYGTHGRREGTPVWPGLNSVVMACVPDDLIEPIRNAIADLQVERDGRLAIRVFGVPVEQIV